jgi:tetratricopeptide (TPR) repeat protein
LQAVLSTSDSQVKWRSIRRLIEEKLLLFALAGVFSVIVYLVAQKENTLISISSLPLTLRIGNALRSYIIYIGKMFWPKNLILFYPYQYILPVWQILCVIMTLTMITLFALWMRKRLPFLIVGWLWYLGTLLPVIGIIQNGQCSYADRYTYIPLIGLFVMAAWGIPLLMQRLLYGRAILCTTVGILLITLVIVTRIQVGYWQDNTSIKSFARAVPEYAAYYHRANAEALIMQNRTHEAFIVLNKSLRLNSKDPFALNDMGFVMLEMAKYKEALDCYEKSIQILPNYRAYLGLGILFTSMKRSDEAIEAYTKALEIEPAFAEAYEKRGIAYLNHGQNDRAIEDFSEFIRLKPGLPAFFYTWAYAGRGCAYLNLDQNDRAIEDFSEAIRLKPDLPVATPLIIDFAVFYVYRGNAYRKLGQNDRAIEDFSEAIRLKPDYALAYLNRGITYMRVGKILEGCRSFKKACELGECSKYNILAKDKHHCQ